MLLEFPFFLLSVLLTSLVFCVFYTLLMYITAQQRDAFMLIFFFIKRATAETSKLLFLLFLVLHIM